MCQHGGSILLKPPLCKYKAPSDEGAVELMRDWGRENENGEFARVLSLRHDFCRATSLVRGRPKAFSWEKVDLPSGKDG